MDQIIKTGTTALASDDVVAQAVQFFASVNWKPTSQSGRTATFEGKPPIPWFQLLAMILGFVLCIVPGIIMYIMVIKKLRHFQNLIVSANPIPGGSEVIVRCPPRAGGLSDRFLAALPALAQ